MIPSLITYLPQTPGLLPKWLFFVSVVSVLNTVQAFVGTKYTERIYPYNPKTTPPVASENPPGGEVTGLSSRTFGIWSLLSGVIRGYGAYRLSNPDVYQMVMWTYAIALFHFGSETVIGTTGPRSAAISPYLVATGSLVWMYNVYGDYVQ